MAIPPLVLRVVADSSGVRAGLAQTQSKIKAFGAGASRAGSALTRGLTLPLALMGAAAVREFGEAQRASKQTEAVLASTGGAANVTKREVEALSASLGRMSAQEDEVIQEGANMLLTFRSIRNEAGKGNDVFTQSVKTLADVSAALGNKPKQAAIQLGKALNDPIRGMSSLRRVGVQFTTAQEAMITRLVESGDLMGAQKVILAELNAEFGGSAKALGDAATPSQKLLLQFKEMGEQIGQFLVPLLEKLTNWIGKVAEWFGRLTPAQKEMVVTIGAIVAAVGPLIFILGKLIGVFSLLAANPWVIIIAATIALVIIIVKNWDKIKAFLIAVWNAIKAVAFSVWNGIKNFAITVWNGIKDAVTNPVRTAKDLIVGIIKTLFRIWVGTWKAILGAATAVVGAIIDVVMGIVDAVRTAIEWLGKLNPLAGEGHSRRQGGFFPGQPKPAATGGPVSSMRPYLVGERGPELFIPRTSGTIVPNAETTSGDITIPIYLGDEVLERVVVKGLNRAAARL